MKTLFQKQNGVTLELRKREVKVRKRKVIDISLVVKDFPPELAEDWFVGEPYAFVTTELPGLAQDEFALDHNFMNIDKDLVPAILKELTDDRKPIRFISSPFVSFPVFRYKQEVLDWDPKAKEVIA